MIDIAIVGGGAAGLSAAIYALRAGAKTQLFEQLVVGGQTSTILQLDNYPGFAHGIGGLELILAMQEQAKQFGLQIQEESVLRIEDEPTGKRLITDMGEHLARAVIIASGATPKKLGLPGEDALTGRGISYCATCDGAFFRDKAVAVVGGGNTALTDALVLAQHASVVYLVHRRDQYRAEKYLQQKIAAEPKIIPVLNATPQELLYDQSLTGLRLAIKTGGERCLEVAGCFVAIGTQPHTQCVAGLLERDAAEQIITDRQLLASRPGFFAAGDCRDTPLRQVITAAADGALAATSAVSYLLTAN